MDEYLVGLLEKLVNTDSGTGDEEGLARVAGLVKAEFERLGFEWKVFKAPDRSQHYYAANDGAGPGGAEKVLLIAHLDTVFPKGTAGKRRFSIEGDLARGPGVSDCKSGVVTIIGALQQLIARHREGVKGLGLGIGCLFNTDEETGSPGSRPFIEELARQSKAVLVVEPAEGENITISRKGIGRFRLQVFGKAAHSGSNYQEGSNAIVALARQIIDIHHLTRLDEGITFNTGVISGGVRPNVIPDYAEAEIDLRITHAGQIPNALEDLQRVTASTGVPGTFARLTGEITRPPMPETPANIQLFYRLKKVAAEMGLPLGTFKSGGGSDANFTAALGTPTLDGLGPIGGGHHSESEFLSLPSLQQRIDLLSRFLQSGFMNI
ncbi:MAG: M20 family metallopeptidase [Firmicutes bacterium]|nr:M20 family metallopeptidase [Bacillota bacterium]